ncbi:MAG: YigZ family protein [Campylobacterota bacterium]
MKTVHSLYSDSIEIKGSKFIAHLMPIAMFESEMVRLRAEHPKAVHWVSASRSLNEFDQVVESSSDDGEPKGTSGKPTLAVLQGHELINAAIITVRYFGGTKLGPGGLVRAYADSANAAVGTAELREYEKTYRKTFATEYKNISIVEYELTQNGVSCIAKEFGGTGAEFTVEATAERLEKLCTALGRLIF